MSSSLRAWAATGAATLASTYLLDAVSTAAGAVLVASGLLDGIGLGPAMAFLVISYTAWGAALRPSLAANWELLQRTGTSTCLPSKVAHDIALRRGAGPRARRIATGIGYVGAELAKEAPYYLGAAGAAFLADSVTSIDAIVFLAGANLGAAAYEYALARATRRLLAPMSAAAGYASFETDWNPARYLTEYYRTVEPDERRTIAFLVAAARQLPAGQSVLVFGAGPTLHHALPFVARARVIDLSDFLAANLSEIASWIDADARAHDWAPFARHALTCEGEPVDDASVARREAQLRARIGRLILSDLRDAQPLGAASPGYDVVVSTYCADSTTADIATWALYMRRIAALVSPGGMLVVAALRQCRGYHVGGRTFPSANIDTADLRRVLTPFAADLHVEAHSLPEQARHGYGGILLARCRMRPA